VAVALLLVLEAGADLELRGGQIGLLLQLLHQLAAHFVEAVGDGF